jgi:hypothetical protein
VLVRSSFDFSGFGDLVQKVVADRNDFADEGLVGLDWSLGEDLGEQLEDGVPALLLEDVLLRVGGEVLGDLGEVDLVLLEEGLFVHGVGDDFLGLLDDV